MVKFLLRPVAYLLLAGILCTCIDPFTPKLNGFKSLLVVDAFVTNENRSYYVKLSLSDRYQDAEPSMVSGAVVTLNDNNDGNSVLQESGPGIYKTDSLLYLGQTGSTYTLHIKTADGTEYESDPCYMHPVPQIDSVYFVKDTRIMNNGSESHQGISIFLNSSGSSESKYYRWVYNECWKFKVPNPKKYNYISENEIAALDKIKYSCWNYHTSDETIIKSTESAQAATIENQPILFVASDLSDRLTEEYSIEIKQLSVSGTEYKFWDNMKQINESGGDIFDKQPFSIVSNIHNITNPEIPVLGYFQVSSVSRKRIFISPTELVKLSLPVYQYDCTRIVIGPDDYPRRDPPLPPVTFDLIYSWFTDSGLTFTEPVYDKQFRLTKLVFSQPLCTDCTLSGTMTRPDFWIDLE